MTTVGFVGGGRIVAAVAGLSVAAGHRVVLGGSRGPQTLKDLVADLGSLASAATAEQAAEAGDIVVVRTRSGPTRVFPSSRWPARSSSTPAIMIRSATAISLTWIRVGPPAAGCCSGTCADRHDGGVVDDGGTDWAGYYAWSAGREPRPLLLAACQELGAGQDRLAIDLGCGEGTDALELLARGWSVLAVDAEPAGLALLRARIPPAAAGRVRILCASFTEADLPRAHLIHAGFSLPFCPPQEFPALWARIRRALASGGVFAGQLFGTRDTWADDPDMTFHARHQVEVLLDGLDILRLEETERDGHAFSGLKHWHTFDILARKPASKHPQAPESR